MASFLYDFLPGDPHPFADQSISFRGAANSLGLADHWQGGSKQPAVGTLLRGTFENKQQVFCPLIVEIVRKGIAYRQKKGTPITREEVRRLNGLIKRLGFKIPELHDPKFLDRLPTGTASEGIILSPETRKRLAGQLIQLTALSPQPRGYAFEKFIQDTFDVFRLAPREAFRLVGEQIDGSFQFQGQTYLFEATWRNGKVGQEELLAFHGKVIGKAEWSRGLHLAYAGFTSEGPQAFKQGKRTSIVCMDGLDLHDVFERNLDLPSAIERKARRAAETNDAFVPVRELFP